MDEYCRPFCLHEIRIFFRDVGRIISWNAPSSYIALPFIQRMRVRSNRLRPRFVERYAMFWLLPSDAIIGALVAFSPTVRRVLSVRPTGGVYIGRARHG